MHSAHHVVHHRTDRDQFMHRVDPLVLQAELAYERYPFLDLLLSQVSQVQVGHLAVGRSDGAPLLLLPDKSLGDPVPRSEFHAAQLRFRRGFAQVVVLQVAVAVLVDQPTTFGASRLGNQDPGERQAGRVVLDELHVLQRSLGPKGQRHPVAGVDVGVGGEREDLAATAGGQHHRLGGDGVDSAGHQLDRHHTVDPAVIDQ